MIRNVNKLDVKVEVVAFGRETLPSKKVWCMFISFHGDVPPFPLSHQQKTVLVLLLKPGVSNVSWLFWGAAMISHRHVCWNRKMTDRSREAV